MAVEPNRRKPPAPGDLGEGTPANVDLRKLGQRDKPEGDWGEPEAGALYGANHARRAERAEVERLQGTKTRRANKDIVSRRG